MANPSQTAVCEENRRILERMYNQRNDQQIRISRLEERVDIRRGEIAEAENRLSRIVAAIDEVGAGGVAIAADILRRDPVALAGNFIQTAVALSRIRAEQDRRLADLRHQYDNDAAKLQAARDKLDFISDEIHRTIAFINANC